MRELIVQVAWQMNLAGVAILLGTRWLPKTTSAWAGIGCVLLIIALGNAWVLATAGLNPSQSLASLFGLVVLGPLGSRFIGNWLTDRAT